MSLEEEKRIGNQREEVVRGEGRKGRSGNDRPQTIYADTVVRRSEKIVGYRRRITVSLSIGNSVC